MKNQNQNEQIIKTTCELAEFSGMSEIKLMGDLVRHKPSGEMNELMLDYVIENKVRATRIDKSVKYFMKAYHPEKFKEYFKVTDEKGKISILEDIREGVELLTDDFEYVEEILNSEDLEQTEENLEWLRQSFKIAYIGSPMYWFRHLGYHNPVRNKILFETVKRHAPFYFKYIELAHLNKPAVYYDVQEALRSENSDSFIMECILKRIELYDEKKLAKSTIKSFLKVVNDPYKISKNNKKLIMDALHEYVPTRIMIELTL